MALSELSGTQASSWSSYQRMRAKLTGRLGRELAREAGVSEADFEILLALLESPDDSVRALSLRCGLEWEKSRLSHQLRRMEQRGLVVRDECVEDNRGSVVRITDAGRALALDAKRQHDQAVQRYVVSALSPAQLESLGEIAELILVGLDEPHRA